jgi:hypothetical protein
MFRRNISLPSSGSKFIPSWLILRPTSLSFLLDFLLNSEYGGDILLRNVELSTKHIAVKIQKTAFFNL